MRTAVFYLISLSLHGLVLAAIAMFPPAVRYEPPSAGTARDGGGSGSGVPRGEVERWVIAPMRKAQPAASPSSPEPTLVLRIEPEKPVEPVAKRMISPEEPMPAAVSPEIANQAPPTIPAPPQSLPELPRIDVVATKVARSASAMAQTLAANVEQGRAAVAARVAEYARAASARTHAPPDSSLRPPQTVAARISGGEATATGRGSAAGNARLAGDGHRAGSGGGGPEQAASPSSWNPKPPYPPEAQARGVEGLVVLHVWLRADGSVRRVSIEKSSGDAQLDASALTTVRDRWEFQPARANGIGIPWEWRVPIRFTLPGR